MKAPFAGQFYLDANTGRMTKYVFNVNGNTDTGQTSWNANGSLGSFQITDNIPGTSDTRALCWISPELFCKATGTETFAKMRIADVIRITSSAISDSLYQYALSAHFDILVSKNNKAYLAIEFDGGGHDARNDARKAAICDFFKLPMIRIKESHLDAKVFEDTAVGFFIWQLFLRRCFSRAVHLRRFPGDFHVDTAFRLRPHNANRSEHDNRLSASGYAAGWDLFD